MDIQFNTIDLAYLTPFFILVAVALLLVLAEAFSRGPSHSRLMALAVAGCVATSVASIVLYNILEPGQVISVMSGMLVIDRFGCFFTVLTAALSAGTIMIAAPHQEEHDWQHGAFFGLVLLSASGMVIIAMAGDMVSIFLGIEIMSLGVYVLTALRANSLRSGEAAMKYFLMGAFATGFLLYGIAMIYGATGHTNFANIQASLSADMANPSLVVVGLFLLVIAMAFKVAAIPFHMWAPDAYEGAPTPVTGFMAAAVKAAAFAAMLRVFSETFGTEILAYGRMGWASPLIVIAAISMTLGNLAALRQNNIKRMLAYSSISHAGIIIVGVVAVGLSSDGLAMQARAGVLYYLMAYGITTIGAFAVASWIGSRGHERVMVDDWSGLASKHPAAALAMTVFMLSLGGIPPTAGFFGKFYVFKSAMEVHDQQLWWLVVIGVINSAISIFYYLRVVMTMYFRDPIDDFKPLNRGAVVFVIIVSAIAVLEMGILPGFWLGAANG